MAAPHPHLALFPHGLSAGAKLLVYLLISIALIAVDTRLNALDWLRGGANVVLYTVQNTVDEPWRLSQQMNAFFVKQSQLLRQNTQLQHQSVAWQLSEQHVRQLEQENQQLRTLLNLRHRITLHTLPAEIVGIPRDPYQRVVSVDVGSRSGVQAGSAAIDANGLLGQLTRVSPITSEITLLTDKNQSVPIQIQRTGQHAILFGTGADDRMDLRYLDHSTDIRLGDVLVTSGLDGLYPPGLIVARVTRLDTRSNLAFDRIDCEPVADVDRDRQVLIIDRLKSE